MRTSDRPTLAPKFDVAQFARECDRLASDPAAPTTDGPSDPPAPSQVRLITRPQWGAVATAEVWARGMTGAPAVKIDFDALKQLPLDHKEGFVLSLMDGSIDLETLVELSGMDRSEALQLVRNLFESGVVEFRRFAIR